MKNQSTVQPLVANDSNPSQMLINAKTAAALLSVSERTLWTLTNRGEIRCVRIGRAVRYDPEDLRAWIAAKKSRGDCG